MTSSQRIRVSPAGLMALVALVFSSLLVPPAVSAVAASAFPDVAFLATDGNAPATMRLGQLAQASSTNSGVASYGPGALTPDGKALVYPASSASSPDIVELHTRDNVTGTTAPLTSRGHESIDPSVSPDGTHVAFFDGSGSDTDTVSHGIYTVDRSTKAITRISAPNDTVTGWPESGACWSRDGARLAYAMFRPDTATDELVVADADGSGGWRVVTHTAPHALFMRCAWTPDDQFILAADSTSNQLAAINVSTGATTQLTHDAAFRIGMVAITDDWRVVYEATPVAHGNAQIRTSSLGDLGTSQIVSSAGDTASGPSVALSGNILAAPAAFVAATGGQATTPPTDPAPPPVTPTPPGPNCPRYVLIGVRGSGQTAADSDGYGSTVGGFKDFALNSIPGLIAESEDYPAINVDFAHLLSSFGPNYVSSKAAGEKVVRKRLKAWQSNCPATYEILVGYSQGAQVVGDVYESLTNKQRTLIAALVLFADPRFNPAQKEVNRGTNFNPKLKGVFQIAEPKMRTIPKQWIKRVYSYCMAGDPVCGWSVVNGGNCARLILVGKCVHTLYDVKGVPAVAFAQVLPQLRALPPLG